LGRDGETISPRAPDAAPHECCRAEAHSTLHGVVFAIFGPGSAVHRKNAAPRPGHESRTYLVGFGGWRRRSEAG
jgi:hypothetical protein